MHNPKELNILPFPPRVKGVSKKLKKIHLARAIKLSLTELQKHTTCLSTYGKHLRTPKVWGGRLEDLTNVVG